MKGKMVTPANSRQSNYNLSEKLRDAIRRRADAETIQSLLEAGADVNARDCHGCTSLLLACNREDNNEDRVQQLINAGADVNYSNSYWTPLHYAVIHGWTETIRLLAKNNVNLDAKGSFDIPPIMLAFDISASISKKKEIVELLINLGATVRSSDTHENTALHYASHYGWLKIMLLLLKMGADPNAKNFLGETPLHDSCRRNQMEFMEHLLKAGADCHIEDEDGETPFRYLIIEWSDVKSIRMLIVNGAYIEPDDYYPILNRALLKEGILQDIQTCSQVILNKFNNKDLPLVYSLPISKTMLPCIELMKIGNRSEKFMEIELNVEQEIQRKGHCNVVKACPPILSMMCVKLLIDCYFTNRQERLG